MLRHASQGMVGSGFVPSVGARMFLVRASAAVLEKSALPSLNKSERSTVRAARHAKLRRVPTGALRAAHFPVTSERQRWSHCPYPPAIRHRPDGASLIGVTNP